MTWVSVSLRKMELKNRINNMESQLMDISQELQTIADESSNEQSKISLKNNYELGTNDQYRTERESIFGENTSDKEKEEAVKSMLSGYFEDPDNITADDLDKFAEEFGLDPEELSKKWFFGLFTCSKTDVDDLYTKLFGNDGINEKSEEQLAKWMIKVQYMDEKSDLRNESQMESDLLRSETDAETQTLEAQQEAIQTQLKAARAEYDSLGEALDKDIETSTIKLV
jgi:hypothetical protein